MFLYLRTASSTVVFSLAEVNLRIPEVILLSVSLRESYVSCGLICWIPECTNAHRSAYNLIHVALMKNSFDLNDCDFPALKRLTRCRTRIVSGLAGLNDPPLILQRLLNRT